MTPPTTDVPPIVEVPFTPDTGGSGGGGNGTGGDDGGNDGEGDDDTLPFECLVLRSTLNVGILASDAITNTGSTTSTGDIDLSPGTSITGAPVAIFPATTHVADSISLQARNDAKTAYTTFNSLPGAVTIFNAQLGGTTILPGIYDVPPSALITGTLILDANNDLNARWVFRLADTLTTATGASIVVINDIKNPEDTPGLESSSGCDVFWIVRSSATIGGDNTFVGTILAATTITVNKGAVGSIIYGRLLASAFNAGAVTLDTTTIVIPTCCLDGLVEVPIG